MWFVIVCAGFFTSWCIIVVTEYMSCGLCVVSFRYDAVGVVAVCIGLLASRFVLVFEGLFPLRVFAGCI
jgi:hypothetical protein